MIEIVKNGNGKHYFRIKAENGEILCHSELYESKDGCIKGLEALIQEARREPFEIKYVKVN